ncbi:hypothetical protein H4I96_11630 [Botrytis cinerea]
MGLYTSFDLVPRLSEGIEDQKSWKLFIKAVKEHYQNDDLVEAKQNFVVLKVDRDLFLLFEDHKLVRISEHFGSRVHILKEKLKQERFYRWVDVYDLRKSFGKLGEPNASVVINSNIPKSHPKTGNDLRVFSIGQVPGKGNGLIARFNVDKVKQTNTFEETSFGNQDCLGTNSISRK